MPALDDVYTTQKELVTSILHKARTLTYYGFIPLIIYLGTRHAPTAHAPHQSLANFSPPMCRCENRTSAEPPPSYHASVTKLSDSSNREYEDASPSTRRLTRIERVEEERRADSLEDARF